MPVRAATSSLRVSRISASAPPTLPHPSRATRTVGAGCACGCGAAARRGAGLVGVHLQTVQAARAATRPLRLRRRTSLWRRCAGGESCRGEWCYHHAAPQAGSLERPPAHGSHWRSGRCRAVSPTDAPGRRTASLALVAGPHAAHRGGGRSRAGRGGHGPPDRDGVPPLRGGPRLRRLLLQRRPGPPGRVPAGGRVGDA